MLIIAALVIAFVVGAIAGRKYTNAAVRAELVKLEAGAVAEAKKVILAIRAKV